MSRRGAWLRIFFLFFGVSAASVSAVPAQLSGRCEDWKTVLEDLLTQKPAKIDRCISFGPYAELLSQDADAVVDDREGRVKLTLPDPGITFFNFFDGAVSWGLKRSDIVSLGSDVVDVYWNYRDQELQFTLELEAQLLGLGPRLVFRDVRIGLGPLISDPPDPFGVFFSGTLDLEASSIFNLKLEGVLRFESSAHRGHLYSEPHFRIGSLLDVSAVGAEFTIDNDKSLLQIALTGNPRIALGPNGAFGSVGVGGTLELSLWWDQAPPCWKLDGTFTFQVGGAAQLLANGTLSVCDGAVQGSGDLTTPDGKFSVDWRLGSRCLIARRKSTIEAPKSVLLAPGAPADFRICVGDSLCPPYVPLPICSPIEDVILHVGDPPDDQTYALFDAHFVHLREGIIDLMVQDSELRANPSFVKRGGATRLRAVIHNFSAVRAEARVRWYYNTLDEDHLIGEEGSILVPARNTNTAEPGSTEVFLDWATSAIAERATSVLISVEETSVGDQDTTNNQARSDILVGIGPGKIDLAAEPGPVEGSVRLTWAAPSGSSASGGVYRYDIRRNVVPISPAIWDQSPSVPQSRTPGEWLLTPKDPNEPEELIVRGLVPGHLYSFAIRAVDFDLSVSRISDSAIVRASTAMLPFALADSVVVPDPLPEGASEVELQVTYINAAGTPPDSARCVVDGAPFTMGHLGGTPHSGAVYRCTARGIDTVGRIPQYRFEFLLGSTMVSLPDSGDYSLGVDRVLTNCASSGDAASTLRTFTCLWRHPAGLSPVKRSCVVRSGSRFLPYEMSLVGRGGPGGDRYSMTVDITADGPAEFYCKFSDGATSYRDPDVGTRGGTAPPVRHDLRVQGCRIGTDRMRGGEETNLTCEVKNAGTVLEPTVFYRCLVDGIQDGSDRDVGPIGSGGVVGDFSCRCRCPRDEDAPRDVPCEGLAVPVTGDPNRDNSFSAALHCEPLPGSLSGFVIDDTPDLNPVTGAEVFTLLGAADQGSATSDTTSGAQGAWRMEGLRPGAYKVRAWKDGLGSAEANVQVHAGEETSGVVLSLSTSQICRLTTNSVADHHPSWMRDEQRIVAARFQGPDYPCVILQCGQPENLLGFSGSFPPSCSRPDASPTSDSIVFDSGAGIWLTDSNATGPSLVIPGGSHADWSPDGAKLVYRNGADGDKLYIAYPSPGFGTRCPITAGAEYGPAWSPDGTKLAVDGRVYALGNATCPYSGTPLDQTSPLCTYSGYQAAWLSDSSGILYRPNPGSGIHVLRLADCLPSLISSNPADEEPALSKSGDKLALSSWRHGTQLDSHFEVYAQSGFEVPSLYLYHVAMNPGTVTPNWDGQDDLLRIEAFISGDGFITAKVYEATQRLVRTLLDRAHPIEDPNAPGIWEVKGPDGGPLVWDGTDDRGLPVETGVYEIRLDAEGAAGERAIPVWDRIMLAASVTSVCGHDPRFGPDGKVVSTSQPPEVDRTDLADPDLTCTNLMLDPVGPLGYDRADDPETYVYWSSGSEKYLTLCTVPGTCDTVDTGVSRNLPDLGVAISPDGETIAISDNPMGSGEDSDIFLIARGGGSRRTCDSVSPYREYWPSFSPDGSMIAFASDREGQPYGSTGVNTSDIWLVGSDCGNPPQKVEFSPIFWEERPAFVPDNQALLFSSDRGARNPSEWDIWLYDIAHPNDVVPRRLALYGESARSSPDGYLLAVEGRLYGLSPSLLSGMAAGQVLEGGSLAPIGGASLTASGPGGFSAMAGSNSLGIYEFQDLEPGLYEICASAPGHHGACEKGIRVVARAEAVVADLTLDPLPHVEILSPRNGDRAASVVHLASRDASGTTSEVNWEASTDPNVGFSPIGSGFDVDWDVSAGTGEQTYILRATACDALGGCDSKPPTVQVVIDHRPPSVQITAPGEPSIPNSQVVLEGAVDADADAIAFEYRLDASAPWVRAGIGFGPDFKAQWNTSALPVGGRVTVRAVASDLAGNTGASPDPDGSVREYTVVKSVTAGCHADPGSACVGAEVRLINDSTGPVASGVWDFGDGSSSGLRPEAPPEMEDPDLHITTDHAWTSGSVHDVTLTVTGTTGETDAAACPVTIHDGTPEVCDGIDNDCNGLADDILYPDACVCDTGLLGECAAGLLACVSGHEVCTPCTLPSAETCDGRDDDCDGTVPPGEVDPDADGVLDCAPDNCVSAYNPTQQDGDGDGDGDACDNCPAAYNPGQENNDGDNEGGDACDITVIFPLQGDVTCADPPPTIRWTPESYDRFRVFLSWLPNFPGKKKVTSGDTLLETTQWTVPQKKWNRLCTNANPNLYIKVFGKNRATKATEESEVVTVRVK